MSVLRSRRERSCQVSIIGGLHGRHEGRPHHPDCAGDSTQATCKAAVERVFDHRYYADMFMGTADAGHSEALRHFMLKGLWNGIVPVPARIFDESFYLSFHADVRAARDAGTVPSGYYHFVTTGLAERRQAVRPASATEFTASGPLPSLRMKRSGMIGGLLRSISVSFDPNRQPVVNVFLPALDPDSAGCSHVRSQDAFWHFLCRLVERGERLRFVATETSAVTRDWFTYRLGNRPRWLRAFDRQEFADISTGDPTLTCHPHDLCLVGSAWMMHPAWSVARYLERKQVAFFVQDDEGAWQESEATQFLLNAAFAIPHVAVFDSAALAMHFRQRGLGVFANEGMGRHLCFNRPAPGIEPDPRALGASGRRRRLLCRMSPDSRDPHGLFEICIAALREAVEEGALTRGWDVTAFGAAGIEGEIALGNGCTMQALGQIGAAEQRTLLVSSDVALALIWSGQMGGAVHEMAGAGVVTVTNVYSGRSARDLARLGHNVVPCVATMQGIVDGLWEAVRRCEDVPARLAASRLDGPASWDDVFSPAFLMEFDALIRGPSAPDARSILMAAE